MGSRSWDAALPRFQSERTRGNTPNTTTPARGGRYPYLIQAGNGSAVVVTGSDARNVRAVQTDIGQLAVAERRQFGNIALILAERLDHADEREQHGSLLAIRFSPWRKASPLK